ncbi:hypothetical protein PanWU01x14_161060 [Parasponia andersonii]|uniref:Uncharacterized protein n=1 Tax=Parasponia andersonii TaxID=3476 RepID=A0A2P5CDP6_PARAD|nr:hypothetical protein PanWU01x14_161060 [Parasponia andersonii]
MFKHFLSRAPGCDAWTMFYGLGSRPSRFYAFNLCRGSSVHLSLDSASNDPSLLCCRPFVTALPGFTYLDKFPDPSLDFYSAVNTDLL